MTIEEILTHLTLMGCYILPIKDLFHDDCYYGQYDETYKCHIVYKNLPYYVEFEIRYRSKNYTDIKKDPRDYSYIRIEYTSRIYEEINSESFYEYDDALRYFYDKVIEYHD